MTKLANDDLEIVSGGEGNSDTPTGNTGRTKETFCSYCKKIRTFDVYSGGRAYCRVCGGLEN